MKTPYLHHQEIKGAIGVKICATGIERALAGSNLYVVGPDDDIEELKVDVMKDLGGILKRVKKNEDGVYVQALHELDVAPHQLAGDDLAGGGRRARNVTEGHGSS